MCIEGREGSPALIYDGDLNFIFIIHKLEKLCVFRGRDMKNLFMALHKTNTSNVLFFHYLLVHRAAESVGIISNDIFCSLSDSRILSTSS